MKRGLVFLLILALLTASYPCALLSAEEGPGASETDEIVFALFDERAKLILESFQFDDVTIQRRIQEIDAELESLGVVFLADNDVKERYGDMELQTSGESRVIVPEDQVNSWALYVSTYALNGTVYEIERLFAQPIMEESPLTIPATTVNQSYSQNWIAGAANVIHVLGEELVSHLHPIGEAAVLFYDFLSSTISAISRTTEINARTISYSWLGVETAVFSYVKENNQPNSSQRLALISTKATLSYGYTIPSFFYYYVNESWTMWPEVLTGRNTITLVPPNYGNIQTAVTAYVGGNMPQRAMVSHFTIEGPNDSFVRDVYPLHPDIPFHCGMY